jgi:general secretion pathway protein M
VSRAERLVAARAWWAGLAVRDRKALTLASVVLGLYLLFAVAIQPAWRVLAAAPAERDRLDAELQTMQQLADEAKALRTTPPVALARASAALQAASERLGSQGRLVVQGDRAVLTVTDASSGALRSWLAEARSGARARPVEARLTRGAGGYSGSIVVVIGGAS